MYRRIQSKRGSASSFPGPVALQHNCNMIVLETLDTCGTFPLNPLSPSARPCRGVCLHSLCYIPGMSAQAVTLCCTHRPPGGLQVCHFTTPSSSLQPLIQGLSPCGVQPSMTVVQARTACMQTVKVYAQPQQSYSATPAEQQQHICVGQSHSLSSSFDTNTPSAAVDASSSSRSAASYAHVTYGSRRLVATGFKQWSAPATPCDKPPWDSCQQCGTLRARSPPLAKHISSQNYMFTNTVLLPFMTPQTSR